MPCILLTSQSNKFFEYPPHYYPFGLTMAGISSKAAGQLENRRKFNSGSEFQSGEFSDGSGLDLYETPFRKLDPQISRFLQIDPLSIVTNNSSPYAYVMNNPIVFNDPLGLDTIRVPGSIPNNIQPGQVVILPHPGGSGNSEYVYDPENPNADENGLVGNGMTIIGESVVITPNSAAGHAGGSVPLLYQAGMLGSNISGSDYININIGFVGAMVNMQQSQLTSYRNNVLLPKARANGFNSYYRRQLKNTNLGLNKLDRVGKRLGYAGLALQGATLADKYLNGDGISKKDVFDAGVSTILTVVAISNPVVLVAVGVYGLLDALGAFDGVKTALGANDDIILQRN